MRPESGSGVTRGSYNRGIFATLYFIGLALLILGYVLLVPMAARTSVAWLDLIVICFVYSVNFLGFGAWRFQTGGFTSRIPRLAIFLWGDPAYALAALGVICWGAITLVPFNLQLLIQLALGFLICLAAMGALSGSERISDVAAEEQGKTEGIANLREAVTRCETAMFTSVGGQLGLQARIKKLKEDIRFLSAVPTAAARSIESELITVLDAIRLVAVTQDESRIKDEVPSLLERGEGLLAIRRNHRTEYGER